MNLLQQFRNFFVTIALTIMLVVSIGFDFSAIEMETTSSLQVMPNQQGIQVADAGSFAKDIEGKTQETIGNITGNREDQVMGKVKQGQSDVMQATENAKDEAQELQERSQAATKNVEGNVQEAVGKVTGNRKDQMEGKLKQAESENRNMVEDMKDTIQGVFN